MRSVALAALATLALAGSVHAQTAPQATPSGKWRRTGGPDGVSYTKESRSQGQLVVETKEQPRGLDGRFQHAARHKVDTYLDLPLDLPRNLGAVRIREVKREQEGKPFQFKPKRQAFEFEPEPPVHLQVKR
jgi:hypothetical protein